MSESYTSIIDLKQGSLRTEEQFLPARVGLSQICDGPSPVRGVMLPTRTRAACARRDRSRKLGCSMLRCPGHHRMATVISPGHFFTYSTQIISDMFY